MPTLLERPENKSHEILLNNSTMTSGNYSINEFINGLMNFMEKVGYIGDDIDPSSTISSDYQILDIFDWYNESEKGINNIMKGILFNKSFFDSLEVFFMSKLQNLYQINNSDEVWYFLKERTQLFPFLIKAALEIRKIFGKDIEIDLIKKDDPESDNGKILVAYINTSHLSVNEARRKFKKFKYDWLLNHIEETNGRFIVHVI